MKNPGIRAGYENGILDVKYADGAVITSDDIKEIYEYGNSLAQGKPYCIMFEPLGHYEVSEDGIEYMKDNPDNKNILAKVYVLNSKEAETKTKFHFIFDKPDLTPQTFKTAEEGRKYLNGVLDKHRT